jgi:5-methylcytosine-specific restriction endonuclease McrA
VTDKFAIKDEDGNEQYFDGMAKDKIKRILETKLLIYECEGTETEIKEWFKTINIAGVPLNDQELLNAIYSGPFVTLGKKEFSNSQNANIQKWSAYISGSANRQDFLERALDWVSKGDISDYMSHHRKDENIKELKTYFNSVLDWVCAIFADVESEMRGLEWGRLYETYHTKAYNPAKVSAEVRKLYGDSYVKNRKGVFEYILGGSTDTKLLDVRVFDDATKKSVYASQTKKAETKGKSNCPYCAIGHDSNKNKIWKPAEMDADHVAAWSKGGGTNIKNCEMLCKPHNRAKGNR